MTLTPSGEDSSNQHQPALSICALSEFLARAGVDKPEQSAEVLLTEFGSLGRLFACSQFRLERVVDYQLALLIRATRELIHDSLFERFRRGPVLGKRTEVAQFLQLQLGSLPHERVLVLYLDCEFRLIHMARIADGATSGVGGDLARIVHLGLDVGATGFVVVHNHPSGDPTASKQDIVWTRRLIRLATELRMRVVDHLVITDGSQRSVIEQMKNEGLM